MSSFQSSGSAAMKSRIMATQVSSSSTVTLTAPLGQQGLLAHERPVLADHHLAGMPYSRMAPVHIAQGDRVVYITESR